MENKILIASVIKKSKIEVGEERYKHLFTSFDRSKLKEKIEEYYKIELNKNEEDEFPYFTDGGFKYSAENENWSFEVQAHFYDIVY